MLSSQCNMVMPFCKQLMLENTTELLCVDTGHGSTLADIIHGFADCLWAGFNTPMPSASSAEDDSADDSAPPDDSPSGGDPRALLVLQLLNDCAWDEAPSLTHLLLGMDVCAGFAGGVNLRLLGIGGMC